MIPNVPWYITLTVIVIDLLVIASLWRLLDLGARRAGLAGTVRRRLGVMTVAALGVWFVAGILAAPSAASSVGNDPFRVTPEIPFFALSSMAVAFIALWRWPELRRAVLAIPLAATVGVQYYRVIGAIFVILLVQGQLPAHFALPAGWGDIAVGLLAPLVALALWRAPALGRPLALAWNGAGLLDLFVAVGMGTGLLVPLLVPGVDGPVPTATAMGAFPLILVPMFTVPISVLLHLLVFAQWRAEGAEGRRGAGPMLEAQVRP